MQSTKDAAHDLKNLCKQTGSKCVEQEGQMSLYFKQEGQDVPILITWLP